MDQDDERENVVEIIYAIDKSGELYIDISIKDFSTQTLQKLASLYASIPTAKFQMQALEILREAFFAENRIDEFTSFATDALVKSKLIHKEEDEEEDSSGGKVASELPLIKPSDLA